MKYADNILKTFAVSMSLVLNCLISWLFLSVSLTTQAVAGVVLVIAGTWLYSVGSTTMATAGEVAYSPVAQNVESPASSAHANGAKVSDEVSSQVLGASKSMQALSPAGSPGLMPGDAGII